MKTGTKTKGALAHKFDGADAPFPACHYRQKAEKWGPLETAAVDAARGRAGRQARRDYCLAVKPEVARKLEERALVAKATPEQRRVFAGMPFAMVVVGFQRFGRDVRVRWVPEVEVTGGGGGERKPITERSRKTRSALAFLVANSPTSAQGMITLTWPDVQIDGARVKLALRAFFDQLRKRWRLRIEWLWWLEFQRRGAPHVHILTAGAIHEKLARNTVTRRGKRKVIFGGPEVSWLWERWLAIIACEHNEDAIRFNRGGIWEKIMKPDGAARYVAKDAWKPHQTTVPAQYSNVGAWWHRSRGWLKPEPLEHFTGGESAVRRALGLSEDAPLYPIIFGGNTK